MKLLHHFGDPLWALGDKSTPDSSFTLARVFPQKVPFTLRILRVQ